MSNKTFLGYDWPEVRAAWYRLSINWRLMWIYIARGMIIDALDPHNEPISTRWIIEALDQMKPALEIMSKLCEKPPSAKAAITRRLGL